MIETNARDFSRNFSRYRAHAARGETVRIHSPDGVFLLAREPKGITGGDLLKKLNRSASKGIFDSAGSARIEEGRRQAAPARSPWRR